jgi:glycosyltransferase involved in cell wall biosynthesis
LLTRLDRRLFEPVVWTNNSALAAAIRPLGIPSYLSRFTILFHVDAPRLDFPNYIRLIKEGTAIVKRHRIGLLHSNSGAPTQWLVPISRRQRLPLLVHLHVPYSQRERFTLLLHQANLAVGVSRGCVEGLLADGMPESRVSVVYNGVDAELLSRGDERSLRTRLGIAPDEVVLTRVGSLISRKGVDLMLRAFAELLRIHPRCHLLVVGEGPDREELERLAVSLGVQPRTHFLGLVDSAGAVLRDATDIAVSPARMEGFGLTVIEAGLFALPVVASDTPGMREILTPEQNGLIVPIGDVAALTAALSRVVGDPALRRRLGGALKTTVEQRFSVHRYVTELHRTYLELLSRWTGQPVKQRAGTFIGQYGRWLRGAVFRRLGLRHRIENTTT